MANSRIIKHFPIPCLVCGVDSGPILWFLALFMGSLVFASISMLIWAYVSGRFNNLEKTALAPIERDKEP